MRLEIKFFAVVGVGFLSLIGLSVVELAPTVSTLHKIPDLCLFKRLLNVSCPGCGLSRAMVLLSRGQVYGAFSMNPLSILLAPLSVLALLRWFWLNIRGLSVSRSNPPQCLFRKPKLF